MSKSVPSFLQKEVRPADATGQSMLLIPVVLFPASISMIDKATNKRKAIAFLLYLF